jgi:hypothetical protein
MRERRSYRRRTTRRKSALTKSTTKPAQLDLQRTIQLAQLIEAARKQDGVSLFEKAMRVYSPDALQVIKACELLANSRNLPVLGQIGLGLVEVLYIGVGIVDIGKGLGIK